MADHPLTRYRINWQNEYLVNDRDRAICDNEDVVYLASEVEARIAHLEAQAQELIETLEVADRKVTDAERLLRQVERHRAEDAGDALVRENELRAKLAAQAQHLEALQRKHDAAFVAFKSLTEGVHEHSSALSLADSIDEIVEDMVKPIQGAADGE